MQKKLIFFSIVTLLLLAVLFLDGNSSPVPVKFILGEPKPVVLSTVVVVSVCVGVLLAVVVMLSFKALRKPKKVPQLVE